MRKVIIWAVIAHCSLLLAQSDLNVSIDLATFKYDDTQTYTDIYYAIPSAGLVFNKQDDGSLRHCFNNESAGHDGFVGKMAEKDHVIARDIFDGDRMFSRFEFQHPIDHEKGKALGYELFYFFKVKLH